MGDLGVTATDGEVATPAPLDAPQFRTEPTTRRSGPREIRDGASGMLPELGVRDKNSANGMAGAIPSTTVLDIMILGRTNESISKTACAGAAAHPANSQRRFGAFPATLAAC